jgi:hypothetical protein
MMFSITEGGKKIGVQDPLHVDGDSVYNKDVNFDLTSAPNFTGDLTSMFGDYETEIVNSTSGNPKTITIRFKRPITSNKIGIGSKTGNFSNVNIELKDLAGTVRGGLDDSANNTKLTSNVYEFTAITFIEVVVEFHTAGTVTISGMFIPKAQSRSISGIDGIISLKNSTVTPLNAAASFVGESEITTNYGAIAVNLYSDQAGTFYFEGKLFGSSTWRNIETYSVEAGEFKQWSFQGTPTFVRSKFTCGGVSQTVFELETILKPVYVKPSSHPIGGVIKANDDAELFKGQLTGERPDGDYGNVAVTNGDNLKISLEEFDPIFNSIPLPVMDPALLLSRGLVTGITCVNKYGMAEDGVQLLPTDIWDRADAAATQRIWLAPTAARIHTITSSSVGDDGNPEGAGVGAQAVRIWYLPDWDTKETYEDVILNGISAVVMQNAAVMINRMKVIPVGTTYAINIGTITATAATDTTVTSQINAGNGQTRQTPYGVPSVQTAHATGYLLNSHDTANPGTTTEVDFNLLANERPDLNPLTFIGKGNLGTISSGTTTTHRKYNPYRVIPGPAILKIQATSTAADTEGVAEFDIYLVDN